MLMDPQCEIIGKYVLPIFRSMLAKELVQKYHLSQTETAKKLGTTQAAVSQYLSSKRAYKGMEQAEEFLPKIQTMASETAKKLVSKEISAGDITLDFCKLCSTFCKKGAIVSGTQAPEYSI
jgi:predicted transcriptional regulator